MTLVDSFRIVRLILTVSCVLAPGCGVAVKSVGFAAGELEVTTAVVDADRDTGWNTSLALGPHGVPHVVYYDRSNHVLRHAWRELPGARQQADAAAGPWQTETVDSDGIIGTYASVAADEHGALHVTYYDETQERLKYANNVGGSWVTEVVDDGADEAKGHVRSLRSLIE